LWEFHGGNPAPPNNPTVSQENLNEPYSSQHFSPVTQWGKQLLKVQKI
jgi:hypothetical protein